MFEIIVTVLFGWLFFKVFGVALHLAWGAAKIVGMLLTILALPFLIVCVIFASGAILIAPLLLLGIAYAIVAC